MKKTILLFIFFIGAIRLFAQNNVTIKTPISQPFVSDTIGLKDYYKSYFPIGVAVAPRLFNNKESADLIKKEFSSMTPENAMKMGPIHPEENRYNWAPADTIVDFAQKNGILLRGHTLCWHNQTPDWLFKKDGKTVTKEELLKLQEGQDSFVLGAFASLDSEAAKDFIEHAAGSDDQVFLRIFALPRNVVLHRFFVPILSILIALNFLTIFTNMTNEKMCCYPRCKII